MKDTSLQKKSRYLAYILRHNPESVQVELDSNGWADVQTLLANINKSRPLTFEELCQIVDDDVKTRYSFNADKTKIRANQGHSVDVAPDLIEATPPEILFHGTAEKSMWAIEDGGILPMNRQYVHLSTSVWTAQIAGKRHGSPVVFAIDCKRMVETGYKFYLSTNGVWLTKFVPSKYLTKLADFKIKIWLDDVRQAPNGYVHCRSVNSAKALIEATEKFCQIEVVDCDHDLGEYAPDGGDGIKLLDWLVERQTFYRIELHTMNPVGRANMQRELDRYWRKQ